MFNVSDPCSTLARNNKKAVWKLLVGIVQGSTVQMGGRDRRLRRMKETDIWDSHRFTFTKLKFKNTVF